MGKRLEARLRMNVGSAATTAVRGDGPGGAGFVRGGVKEATINKSIVLEYVEKPEP